MKTAEARTSEFYNTVGWVTTDDGVTEDARRYEDLRKHAKEYVSNCRLRVTRHVGSGGRMLDMASGPIQYPEYLSYSASYNQRYCVDLSAAALREAEKRLGPHGVYLHGSFLNMELADDYFDCAVSLHTIYHIDKDAQEEAVRKLLRVTKPGRPVIIVYSNPRSLAQYIHYAASIARRFGRRTNRRNVAASSRPELYFFAHRVRWFERFRDVADIRVLPWRSFTSQDQKRIFPDNWLGRWMLAVLFNLEDTFPGVFARLGQYPMVILRKRGDNVGISRMGDT